MLQVEKIVYRDKIVEVGKVDNSKVSVTTKTDETSSTCACYIYIYIYIYIYKYIRMYT